ncbi:hypothetical protein Tco_0895243 [Tanacetum coccineum]|uniref:Uncharacterized protein n=1 Tax=Tanacetum coccineum TaxID=301880 RepID=A0ABQ5CHI7_9ASTR
MERRDTPIPYLYGTFWVILVANSAAREEKEEEEEEEDEEEKEKEESKKKGSKEALEMGSNSESSGYAASDNEVESYLESTARSEPKCKEMEDTCESGIRPKPDSSKVVPAYMLPDYPSRTALDESGLGRSPLSQVASIFLHLGSLLVVDSRSDSTSLSDAA